MWRWPCRCRNERRGTPRSRKRCFAPTPRFTAAASSKHCASARWRGRRPRQCRTAADSGPVHHCPRAPQPEFEGHEGIARERRLEDLPGAGRREAEARIVVRMAKHDHGVPSVVLGEAEAGADQRAADTAVLPAGPNGHRCQRKSGHDSIAKGDSQLAEQDVADDHILIDRHQLDRDETGCPQVLDQLPLGGAAKGGSIIVMRDINTMHYLSISPILTRLRHPLLKTRSRHHHETMNFRRDHLPHC